MAEEIVFNYDDYVQRNRIYPDFYDVKSFHNQSAMLKLRKTIKERFNDYEVAMEMLRNRTTKRYFQRTYAAQTEVQSYSVKAFPAYKFILPETLADDWASTVDWHKEWPTRDHSLHQPLSAYIVQRLLGFGNVEKSLLTPNGRLLPLCADKLLNSAGTEYIRKYFESLYPDFQNWDSAQKQTWATYLFYESAVVAALFHDMGYPWQFVNRLKEHIDFADYLDEEIANLGSGDSIFNYLENHLLALPFNAYQSITDQLSEPEIRSIKEVMHKAYIKSHGFPGALAFTALTNATFTYPTPFTHEAATTKLKMEMAAVAILMHDMEGLYRKGDKCFHLSFDVDPLSCIIAMADVLEEFERPSASFENDDNNHEGIVHITYKVPCVGTNLTIEGGIFKVEYLYKTDDDADSCRKRRKEEIDNYFGIGKGFIDLTTLGITNIACDTLKV